MRVVLFAFWLACVVNLCVGWYYLTGIPGLQIAASLFGLWLLSKMLQRVRSIEREQRIHKTQTRIQVMSREGNEPDSDTLREMFK